MSPPAVTQDVIATEPQVVTAVYEDRPGAAAGPTGHPSADRDLQPLLRRRLLVFVGLGVWGAGLYVVGRLSDLPAVWASPSARVMFAAALALLGVAAAAFGVLLRGRWLPVGRLRVIEAVGLAAVCGFAVANTWDPVPASLLTPEASTYAANNDALIWFVAVTLYGVLVPNTLRRARRVTAVILAVAVGSTVLAWTRYDLSAELWRLWLTNLFVFLGLAAGLTVFNSARLDEYRRAALRQVGRYRLLRPLGAGGMGEVFLAEHPLLKRACAVKLIRPDKAADPGLVRRFEREVAAAARLTHPAAVQVYDYGREPDGTLYYVMEYLPGLTLDQAVRGGGRFTPDRAVRVLRQVCGALAEAHALGLVHRDVKPANVMLGRLGGRDDAAKLLDFGLVADTAATDTRVTQAGGLLGTPAYMSPEQARGAATGPASDLYSLGATAYFLLTGRPPFPSANPLELLHAHQSVAVEPPSVHVPGLPAEVEAVVLRLLAKRPADRYPDAAAAAAALAACTCGPAVAAA